jgi:pimeloyl-ACP methyl ester carboxylesterase
MTNINSKRRLIVMLFVAMALPAHAWAQAATASVPGQSFTVFLRSRPVGQETVAVVQNGEGWLVRGSNRLGPPLDIVTRIAAIQYDAEWRPLRLLLEGTARGQEARLETTFANGQASSQATVAGTSSAKTDTVAADTIVLPNAFLGSYMALARRLVGQKPGAAFRAYVVPQGEVPLRLAGVFSERIETPQQAIAATRYAIVLSNPTAGGDVDIPMNLWADAEGALLRMSIPAQMLDVARDDVASAATRMTSFSIPGDEGVRIPSSGFSMAASVSKPANAKAPLPAIILIGGAGASDRDGAVAGIPVLGQIAADLAEAGFFVVRYDRRGVGQSGGRGETATISDYADDVRAIVTWLEKQRKDVDKKRIGLVGHGEGAWVAMTAAARDKRVTAIALLGAVSTSGSDLVLEQQQRLLERMNATDAEKEEKIALQKRIHEASLKGRGWEGIPDQLRNQADTPTFHSFLAFDPARVMRDVRQPVLVLQGELDTQVPPHHGDRLADLARARKRKVAVDLAKIPGVNHLLVPAKTGAVDEYATLPDREVSSVATAAIATWMARNL